MRDKRMLVLLIGGFLASGATALAQFEGTADLKITTNTGKGETLPATGRLYVTRNAYRMEWQMDLSRARKDKTASPEAPQRIQTTLFGTIAEPDKITMLDDAHRTYSVWDLKKTRGEAAEAPRPAYTVKKLGSDSVAGLPCQKAELTSSSGTVIEVCVAKDFIVSSDWLATLSRRQRDSAGWLGALRDNGLVGFPVRYAMRARGATEPFMTMVVTKIDREPVSASLFEVPAGYKQTEFAIGGLSPEQQKAVSDARTRMREALDRMTPEQRKAYEDAMKRYARPTPAPTPAP